MRTKITMLLTICTLLFSGMFALASPAAAAPAEPYNFSDCYDVLGDGSIVVCIKEHGVMQSNETPSGNVKSTFNGQFTYTLYINGELAFSETSKSHYTFVGKDGEMQVDHQRASFSNSFDGITCTFSYNIVFANGELRHEAFASECS